MAEQSGNVIDEASAISCDGGSTATRKHLRKGLREELCKGRWNRVGGREVGKA